MAIRIRKVDGMWVALCAVEADKKEGDIYLDDACHEALSTKFALDWKDDFLKPGCKIWDDRLVTRMEKEKVRDAEEELQKWFDEQARKREDANKWPCSSIG